MIVYATNFALFPSQTIFPPLATLFPYHLLPLVIHANTCSASRITRQKSSGRDNAVVAHLKLEAVWLLIAERPDVLMYQGLFDILAVHCCKVAAHRPPRRLECISEIIGDVIR